MSMKTLFDVIFSTNKEREAALNAHRNSFTDAAEETVITQFLDNEEYKNGINKHRNGANNN